MGKKMTDFLKAALEVAHKASGSELPYPTHADRIAELERELAEAHDEWTKEHAEWERELAEAKRALSDANGDTELRVAALERERDRRIAELTTERDEWKHNFDVANTKDHEAIAADRAVERALGRAETDSYAVKILAAFEAALTAYHDEAVESMPGGVYVIGFPEWYEEAREAIRQLQPGGGGTGTAWITPGHGERPTQEGAATPGHSQERQIGNVAESQHGPESAPRHAPPPSDSNCHEIGNPEPLLPRVLAALKTRGLCLAADQLEAVRAFDSASCDRCGGTGKVTLFGVDNGIGFEMDADDQPCPECGAKEGHAIGATYDELDRANVGLADEAQEFRRELLAAREALDMVATYLPDAQFSRDFIRGVALQGKERAERALMLPKECHSQGIAQDDARDAARYRLLVNLDRFSYSPPPMREVRMAWMCSLAKEECDDVLDRRLAEDQHIGAHLHVPSNVSEEGGP